MVPPWCFPVVPPWCPGTYINCGASAPVTILLNDTNITWAPDADASAGIPLLSKAAAPAVPLDLVNLVGQVPSIGAMNRSSSLSLPYSVLQSARMVTQESNGRSTYSIPVSCYHAFVPYSPTL